MRVLPTSRLSPPVLVAILGLPLVAVATAVAVHVGLGPLELVAGAFVVVVVLALFLMPVHWLPATSILIFATVPTRFIPSDGPFRAMTPLTIIIVIWVFRRIVLRQSPPVDASDLPPLRYRGARLLVYIPAAFLVLWLAYSLLTSSFFSVSASWSVSFLSAIIAPMLVPDSRAEGIVLRKAVIWAGAIAGAYVVVEMVTGSSPIYGTLYDAIGRSALEPRTWSVYRAMASFSHPLFAASFFTIPAVLSLGVWMQTGRFRYLVAAGLAGLGVFGTVSRGALLAVAAGAAIVFVAALFDPTIRARARMFGFGLLGVAAVVFAANFGPLQERADSIEAIRSNETRDLGVIIALKTANHYDLLGSGPGTSGQATDLYLNIPIENSGLQLLVSIGVPGVLIVVALVGGLVINALSVRDIGAAASVAALSIAFVGFNVIDAVNYMHALIGVVVLLSMSAHGAPFTTTKSDSDVEILGARGIEHASRFPSASRTTGGTSWI